MLFLNIASKRLGFSKGMQIAIQIKGIDHIVLLVSDVKRAVAFYCDVLGCTRDRERTDLGLNHLLAGPVFIDLVDTKGK